MPAKRPLAVFIADDSEPVAEMLKELITDPGRIEVVVHPQSVIHSMVQFRDGSMKAQMGLPDMKLPIQYALGYPDRLPTAWPRFDFMDHPASSTQSRPTTDSPR